MHFSDSDSFIYLFSYLHLQNFRSQTGIFFFFFFFKYIVLTFSYTKAYGTPKVLRMGRAGRTDVRTDTVILYAPPLKMAGGGGGGVVGPGGGHKKYVSHFFMRNPYMKFQNPSMHSSKVRLCIKMTVM